MSSKPFFPWMGGKRRLAKKIIPNFPEHKCYVEPFAGGAAIFFMKEQSEVEVINDANGELVNLYRVVQNHLEEFVRHFKWALVGRKVFEWAKLSNPETLTDIQRAARFYYLQKTAFGAKVSGQNYGTSTTKRPGLNLLRIEEELSAAHLRLSRVSIENLDWEKCIKRYDREHTLFYLDPPYFETADYGIEFALSNYELMAQLMADVKGKVVLSINDHEVIRDIFKGFRIEVLPINYTVGGGSGIKTQELLIYNW